jgi:nitroimidazol reductase NimA-like FMN-containing flavoprotein (pyridoxamine 5'-phosphate oxidase superfamily)
MSELKAPDILTKRCTRKLKAEELEARILKFLASSRICVLSTCRDNIPRATPIEFRSKGLTLYMAAEPGTKIRNIQMNPWASVGIFSSRSEATDDWHGVEGLQVTGHARLIKQGEPEFMEIYRLFGKPEQWIKGWAGMMLEITPDRMEYLCMALKDEDYAARQIWTRQES